MRLKRVNAGRVCGLVSLVILSVVAFPASPASAAGCPNEALRVGPSANLPDCRAYEVISPAEKNSGLLEPVELGLGPEGTASVISSSETALAGLGETIGFPSGWYSTTRTAEGWATFAMPPLASGYQLSLLAGGFTAWLGTTSLDGRAAVWSGRANGQPEDAADLFLARVPGPAVEDIGPVAPPGTPLSSSVGDTTIGLRLRVVGVSADLSHVLFRLNPKVSEGYRLWPFDATSVPASQASEGPTSLYEYVGTCGTGTECEASEREPLLVGVDDAGNLISTCGTWLGDTHHGFGNAHNALSLDGRAVFFTAHACDPNPGTSPPVDELFARIDNGESGARTVAISEPMEADCSACYEDKTFKSAGALAAARFHDASTDGSKVFFTTTQLLLGEDTSQNIYEYDFDAPAGGKVIRVSAPDASVPASSPAEVLGIVRSSEDGSHVYFVASGVLTANPNSQGQHARAGADNFYVFERDARYPAGHVAFIASLYKRDELLWTAESTADTTPDGRFLVFTSTTEHLTPDDTSAATQVFEYDAQTEKLIRISIGQDGCCKDGNTEVAEPFTRIANKPFYNGMQNPLTYWSGLTMSTDGSYVFFESSIGLTPQAIDHKKVGEFNGVAEYATNIYEYHDGNVYLISDGHDLSERGVKLAGTDASGDDVFFSTVDRLVPQDADSNFDIYDARIGGGFYAPPAPAECVSDGCQGALSAAPVLLSPGSEFQAGGNPPLATPTAAKPRSLTQAQKLANALKACAKQPKKRRAACRSQARKRYRAKKSVHTARGRGRS
jgi:hypothetical protein